MENKPFNAELMGYNGILIRQTVRSGRTVHSDGHVVVLGDVNPGAKITARGDVLIWGKLRGTVHAAIDDENPQVVVCALTMMPNQLRIGEYLATTPWGTPQPTFPEIAMVRDGRIVVERWQPAIMKDDAPL